MQQQQHLHLLLERLYPMEYLGLVVEVDIGIAVVVAVGIEVVAAADIAAVVDIAAEIDIAVAADIVVVVVAVVDTFLPTQLHYSHQRKISLILHACQD